MLVFLGIFLLCLLLLWRRWTPRREETSPVATMIVLGSGGHTTEMFRLLKEMDLDFYRPRFYVVADTDTHSDEKRRAFELQNARTAQLQAVEQCLDRAAGRWEESYLLRIGRSREVGQSVVTSIFTTLAACLHAVRIIVVFRPGLLLVNGPGTCIPVCLAVRLCSLCGLCWNCRIVFFESIARVRSISLSGKVLYHLRLTDLFLVQWPDLTEAYPRSEYVCSLF